VMLVGAAAAWVLRPGFGEIETRLEEALRAEMEPPAPIVASPPSAAAGADLTCVLDAERSRVVSVPEDDVPLAWAADGCVNSRTQYGLSSGDWTRVFVPADEAAVSVSRFDPQSREYIVERYQLSREAMTAARAARAAYNTPQCGRGAEAARDLGTAQQGVVASLPPRPNERLVYRCNAAQGSE
jgi:serine protease Do